MVTLHPGDVVSSASTPVPASLFGWQPTDDEDVLGFFAQLAELEFRVLNASGTEQVAWTAVDVELDELPGHTGLYAPGFTVPGASTSYGTWTIQWRFRVESTDPQQTATTRFRVVAATQPIADAYAQVQDMLDEGVPAATYSVARIARALELASRLFEEWTGWVFDARPMEFELDGRGGPILQLELPVVGLTDASLSFTAFTTSDVAIEAGDLRVYNRHIRSRLVNPDDRQNPRVEWLRLNSTSYPRRGGLAEADLLGAHAWFGDSQQNIKLAGVFGYTDPDGTPFGKVPELVREVVMRIAMRKLAPLWTATAGGTTVGVSGPVTSEKTMDQSVTFANLATTGNSAFAGSYTGDPEIDQIILTYRRPPLLRSA